jgi:signal transduction histidine kinase
MPRRALKRLALLAGLIGLLSAVSFTAFRGSGLLVSFWPANALALAFILRGFATREQRSAALGATVAVMIVASLIFGDDPVRAVAFSLGNGLEIGLAAWVLRRAPMPLADETSLLRLVLGAVVLGPLTSSVVAGLALGVLHGAGAILPGAVQWFAADAVGMAVFAPVFLALRPISLSGVIAVPALLRAAGAQALLVLASLVVFTPTHTPVVFALWPFIVLTVWTGRGVGAALSVVVVSTIGVAMTLAGYGPVHLAGASLGMKVLALQVIAAAQVLTVHPLAVVLNRLDGYVRAAEAGRVEAEAVSAARAQLLAHVSHEIRSPLSGVLGMARLLKAGSLGELNPLQRESLARIAACAGEINALSADLIDTAAVQTGRLNVALASAPLAGIVDAAIVQAGFRAGAMKPAIAVAGTLPDDLQVLADPLRLKQILVNLIVNGAKYGGRPPRVEIAVVTRGARVRIEVDDNGAGVAAELRAKLFKPFSRLGAEKTDVEGSGLGLALSRELVLAQGGAMGVEDSPLGGARFWVELDRAEGGEAALPPARVSGEAA